MIEVSGAVTIASFFIYMFTFGMVIFVPLFFIKSKLFV